MVVDLKPSNSNAAAISAAFSSLVRSRGSAALQKNPFAMGSIYRLAEESGEFVVTTDLKQVGGQIAVPIRSKNMAEFLAEFGRKVGE